MIEQTDARVWLARRGPQYAAIVEQAEHLERTFNKHNGRSTTGVWWHAVKGQPGQWQTIDKVHEKTVVALLRRGATLELGESIDGVDNVNQYVYF